MENKTIMFVLSHKAVRSETLLDKAWAVVSREEGIILVR